MSGTEVRLEGPQLDAFIGALARLVDVNPVIVGGLAVMSRLGTSHRVTLDVDSTFDRPHDPPTTTLLVASGIALPDDAIQRVIVDGTKVDVIDTFAIDESELPDDQKDRLFVCAHRYAWETGEPVHFIGDTAEATPRVATLDALIGMKSHALRFATKGRRATKRSSDLYDLLLMSRNPAGRVLADAPWGLAGQVHEALAEDLANLDELAATLRRSGAPGSDRFTADTTGVIVARLRSRLKPATIQ